MGVIYSEVTNGCLVKSIWGKKSVASKGSDLKVFGRITMGENGNKVKDTF